MVAACGKVLMRKARLSACRLKRVGEAAALVASLQAEQAALARQIAEAEQASAVGARQQELSQVNLRVGLADIGPDLASQ